MRKVVTDGAVLRLRQVQEDNMPYLADIFGPPSKTATANGQPSKVPVTIGENVKCRVSPIKSEEAEKLVAGQVTSIPAVRVSFPFGTGLKQDYWLVIKNHPDLSKLSIISKLPIHANSIAEAVYCSV